VDGTARVVERLAAAGDRIDYCIVGEPSSVDALGDMIKNGRAGHCRNAHGQGNPGARRVSAAREEPDPQRGAALAELAATNWDGGNEHFPPTTWQCSEHPTPAPGRRT